MSSDEDCPAKKWLFTAEQLLDTPSFRDGIPSKQEQDIRKSACKFLAEIGQNMIYPATHIAINSARIFLHRFYMTQSLKEYSDYKLVAITCLFVACKTEECLRALRDFIWAWNQFEDGHPFGRYSGDDARRKPSHVEEETPKFQEIRHKILHFERDLLHVLGFDFQIYHPQAYVLRFIQFFETVKRDKETRSLVTSADGETRFSELGNTIATTANAMVNDSTLTNLGIRYEPSAIGAACTALALKTHGFKIPTAEKWTKKMNEEFQKELETRFNTINVTKEQIEVICNQLLDLYDEIQNPKTHPAAGSATQQPCAAPPAPTAAPAAPSAAPPAHAAPPASAPPKAAPAPAPAASAQQPPAAVASKSGTDKREKLEAGELVLMPGSGPKPYELLRKGNVYSCSCSIWRNIDDIEQRRTCKHLRQLRGEKAETGRVGEEGIRKSDEKLKELLEADKRARMAAPQPPGAHHGAVLGKRPMDPAQPDAMGAKRQHVA